MLNAENSTSTSFTLLPEPVPRDGPWKTFPLQERPQNLFPPIIDTMDVPVFFSVAWPPSSVQIHIAANFQRAGKVSLKNIIKPFGYFKSINIIF